MTPWLLLAASCNNSEANHSRSSDRLHEHLASCEVGQARDFECPAYLDLEILGQCPETYPIWEGGFHGWSVNALPTKHRTMEPDPILSALHREARVAAGGSGSDCCYSRCRPLETRPLGHATEAFVSLICVPPMKSLHPSPVRPECPAAIAGRGEMYDHVPPLLPDTRIHPRDERVARPTPTVPPMPPAYLYPAIAWCCYHSAPAAVILPE